MEAGQSLRQLQELIDKLTGPDGCPWDKEQTPLTLADYIIEESHELVAAIRAGDRVEVCEELGDLLFLLVFISRYYEKNSAFTLADSLKQVSAKMVRRHPHVFANVTFESLEEQLKAWEQIKKREKEGKRSGLFQGLPANLPALVKAYRINSKAARVGFTWEDDEEVEQQVESEWLEWLDACAQDKLSLETHELGDLLFSLVELGRRKGIKANEALDFACIRFLRRFSAMEEMAKEQGRDLAEMTLDEKDELWNKAKEQETDE